MAKQLKDNEYIKIRFCKDDFTLTVPYSLTKKDGSYYVNLSLKTAMIRYVNDRFVDVELVVSEKTGLKISEFGHYKKTVLYGSKRVFYTGRRFIRSRTYDRKPCWRYRFGNTGSAKRYTTKRMIFTILMMNRFCRRCCGKKQFFRDVYHRQ